VDSEVQDWKHKYAQLERSHDELVERNKMQCDDHQSEIRLLKTSIEKLEEENKLIRTSISAASSGSTCNDDLLDKICDLVDQNTSLVERCQEFEVLKEENCELQESLKEATNCAETAKKSIEDLKSENAALEEELELERNACEYLRQESCSSDCLEELREANDRLTAELKEKNDAMHLIKGAMDSLKADQQSIKETVVRLRMENLKLQDEKEEVVKAKAIRPPPPLNSDLESRLEQIERDNKGLREANNDLSTKLTDEIGRTKSLEQANKGLADRICTLVEFIKEIKDYRSS
jgi:chromosome segregation ATPase